MLNVENTLPSGLDESTRCKWELRNTGVKSKAVVKSCIDVNIDECQTFPLCKQFNIDGLSDANDYHLTVYNYEDTSIFGVDEMKKSIYPIRLIIYDYNF